VSRPVTCSGCGAATGVLALSVTLRPLTFTGLLGAFRSRGYSGVCHLCAGCLAGLDAEPVTFKSLRQVVAAVQRALEHIQGGRP